MRLPLASVMVAEVTVEFSTNFGMPNPVRPQLRLETIQQFFPGLLGLGHCAGAPPTVRHAQEVIDGAYLPTSEKEQQS
jgi:hypothetical protein